MNKILLVTNILERGGAENHIFLLLKELAQLKQFQLTAAFYKITNESIKT